MSNSEIKYVRNIAKNKINIDNNYIDNETKWLYNNKNGKSYFALYSTTDLDDPTILYACKGDRARREYSNFLNIYERVGELLYDNEETRPIDRILSSIESEQGNNSIHNGGSKSRRSNIGNAGLYNQNQRNGFSKAFINCLENIAEIHERRGDRGVKYSDLVTYDDNGNIIPLSERFNEKKEDIRYSSRGGEYSKALTSDEWKKYNNAMTSGIDAGLRINDHSMLVECEKGDYSYKLVIYDNTFEENPIKAIYAISRSNEPTTNNNFDEKLIAEYITTSEDKEYDNKQVLERLLKAVSKNVGRVIEIS